MRQVASLGKARAGQEKKQAKTPGHPRGNNLAESRINAFRVLIEHAFPILSLLGISCQVLETLGGTLPIFAEPGTVPPLPIYPTSIYLSV